MITPELLLDVFVEIADTLVDGVDTDEFRRNLVSRVVDVSGADAVVMSLADERGRLRIVANSPGTAVLGDLLELLPVAGPSYECFSTRHPVVAPMSVVAGFSAVHAFPLRLRDEAVGVLTLLSSRHDGVASTEARVVQSLADIATIAMLHERNLARAEALAEQLQTALDSRIVIEQAKGVLAQTQNISVDEAFTLMRERARSTRSRLIDVATAIVATRH